ncbi:IS66 family insertion sequence element accessory protein TnpA [Tepidibacillus fermentans]|uniref:Transposase n=1 Tax=Tepidibacillus fermentans TaxID=1281767 RepID=A0A4R3KM11_9BACI|nr:hypothetical protein [Tepidibacillus fermentans]TCS84486.1 hypothetical protein EDD72_101150 [Tepidibacillus fermentans]
MSDTPTKLSFQEWDELIEKYRNSGLSVIKWCEIHGFKPHQLRWQIKKRQKLNKNEQTIQWVPLHSSPIESSSRSISVKIGHAEITVSEGFNKELFAEVVYSLLSIC